MVQHVDGDDVGTVGERLLELPRPLADTVLLFRYFEYAGEIRQALSVIKKRSGPHERAIRELVFGEGSIHVGEPLKDFEGVLTGVPTYVGDASQAENSPAS